MKTNTSPTFSWLRCSLHLAKRDSAKPSCLTFCRMKTPGARFLIYNNIDAARAEAKRTNKPLFVTFRCVPCHACKRFDAEVAKNN